MRRAMLAVIVIVLCGATECLNGQVQQPWSSGLPRIESGSATPGGSQSTHLGGGLAAAAIVYFSRKWAIGGWLLWFLVQVFGGALFSAVLFILLEEWKNYDLAAWDDSRLYVFCLLRAVPQLIAIGCVVGSSIALLWCRDWRWVIRLRAALVAQIGAVLVALAIDSVHFRNVIAADLYGLIFSTAFLLYLVLSKRVQRVFKSKDWGGGTVPAHPHLLRP